MDQQSRLRSYLHSNDLNLLIKVAEAKAITLEVEAHADQLQAVDSPKFTDSALARLKESHKYRNFIAVLKEIQELEQFHTVKLVQV